MDDQIKHTDPATPDNSTITRGKDNTGLAPASKPISEAPAMYKNLRHALLVTFAAQGVTLILSIAFVLLTSRWLGPSGKGFQSLLMSIGQIASVLLGFGFQGALPALVSKDPQNAPAATQIQLRLLVLAAAILLVAAYANAFFGWTHLGWSDALTTSVFALATITQIFCASIALALGDYWTSNLSAATSAAMAVAIAISMYLTRTVTPASVIFAQSLGLAAGSAIVVARMRYSIWDRQATFPAEIGSFLRPSFLGFLSALFSMLMFRGDIFLVTLLGGGLANAGIYSIAVFAAEMALKAPQWAAAVLTPVVAADAAAGRRKTIQLFWLSTGLTLVAFVAAVVLKTPIVNILTLVAGSQFAGAYVVMIAIFPRVILQSGTTVFAANLAGKGFTIYHPLATFVGMVGVLFADWLFIPRYGIVGGGYGSCAGYSLAVIIIFIGFLKHNGLNLREFSIETAGVLRLLP